VQLSRRRHLLDREIAEHHAGRAEGNRAVVELKLNATTAEAAEDFESLAAMIQVLHYPLGLFVNIASTVTHADLVPEVVPGLCSCVRRVAAGWQAARHRGTNPRASSEARRKTSIMMHRSSCPKELQCRSR
jgi:hypothetical protein